MSHVIVIEFVTLDGVIQDPDGSGGSSQAGWAFRYGPEPVAGDPFGLSEVLDTGALLLGRRTWQMFAGIWPGRDDPFSAKMNAMPKLVMSRSLEQADGWQNSAVLRGDLVTEVGKRQAEQDIVVMGSASVVQKYLQDDDLGAQAPFAERGLAFVRGYQRDLDRNQAALRAVRQELARRGFELTEVRILDLLIWSAATAA